MRLSRLILSSSVLVLILVGCGGASPLAGNEPADVARQAMSLLQARDVSKLTDLACAAQQDSSAR